MIGRNNVIWIRSISMLICFCLLISVSFSGNAVAKKNKGSEVLRNDKQVAEVMVEEEGIQYIASMDKSSGEIKMRMLHGEQEEKEYVVLLDGIEEDEKGVASIYGRYIDQETGEVEKFGDTSKKSMALLSSGAVPLDLQLKLALEALLLATAYIVVNGLDYVLTDALEDHIEKNKSKYYAAYIYYFRDEGTSKVVIGPPISKAEAEGRLMEDADIFAKKKADAKAIFTTVTRGPEIHGTYGDYLYHYHGKVPDDTRPGKLRTSDGHSFYPGR